MTDCKYKDKYRPRTYSSKHVRMNFNQITHEYKTARRGIKKRQESKERPIINVEKNWDSISV
jgi:hypothetical protein